MQTQKQCARDSSVGQPEKVRRERADAAELPLVGVPVINLSPLPLSPPPPPPPPASSEAATSAELQSSHRAVISWGCFQVGIQKPTHTHTKAVVGRVSKLLLMHWGLYRGISTFSNIQSEAFNIALRSLPFPGNKSWNGRSHFSTEWGKLPKNSLHFHQKRSGDT